MPGWEDAVQEAPGGIRLLLEVSAGARQARFPDGHNPWRDGRIGIRVQAPAQEDQANAEVVRAVAAFFAHPTGRIHLEAGATDARKALRVMGLGRSEAVARLAPHLEGP